MVYQQRLCCANSQMCAHTTAHTTHTYWCHPFGATERFQHHCPQSQFLGSVSAPFTLLPPHPIHQACSWHPGPCHPSVPCQPPASPSHFCLSSLWAGNWLEGFISACDSFQLGIAPLSCGKKSWPSRSMQLNIDSVPFLSFPAEEWMPSLCPAHPQLLQWLHHSCPWWTRENTPVSKCICSTVANATEVPCENAVCSAWKEMRAPEKSLRMRWQVKKDMKGEQKREWHNGGRKQQTKLT